MRRSDETSGTPWSRASVEGASVASWTDRWTDRPSTDSHQTKFHTVVDYSAVRQNKAWPSTAAAGGHSLTACINDLTLGSPKTRCQTLTTIAAPSSNLDVLRQFYARLSTRNDHLISLGEIGVPGSLDRFLCSCSRTRCRRSIHVRAGGGGIEVRR